nr:MAG TPA: holin [Caudoviricetes sp.]
MVGVKMKLDNLGVVEFEVFLIVLMMILDIILGTIDHDFFSKDGSSANGIKGLFSKLGITSFLVFAVLVLHINDWGEFKGINDIVSIIRNGVDTIILMLIYFEFTSVLAHLHNITGIDFSGLPMVKQEIESKELATHKFKQEIDEMKEKKENDSNN